jgi:hypothetical protein
LGTTTHNTRGRATIKKKKKKKKKKHLESTGKQRFVRRRSVPIPDPPVDVVLLSSLLQSRRIR